MKLQDAGALIGGIVKTVMNIFLSISFIFNYLEREKYFIENLFEYLDQSLSMSKYINIKTATMC